MKTIKWVAIAAFAFAFIACCPCRKHKSNTLSSMMPLTGTEWKAVQLHGEAIDSENYRLTLDSDGTISGVGDCNRFSGSYTQNANRLSIGENMASTRMFCLNQEREDQFLKMLINADSYTMDGSKLMLLNNGEVTAIFTPAM